MYLDKAIGLIIIFSTLISVLNISVDHVESKQTNWVIQNISFRSRTGSDVYPGSLYTTLSITLRYMGNREAWNSIGCIYDLPRGFSVVGSTCSPSRNLDDEVEFTVEPGELVYFSYTMHVDRNITPGLHEISVNISYYTDTGVSWEIIGFEVNVAEYPPLNISIEDIYLSPYSYPGSCPVNVVIRARNNGRSVVDNMVLRLRLQDELADPPEINYSYPVSLEPGEVVYLNMGSTCIETGAEHGVYYNGSLYVYAQLSTDDGVLYADEAEYNISLVLDEPPSMKIRIVDYKLTNNIDITGFKNTGLTVMLRSEEQGLIRLSHSIIRLENARSLNGSTYVAYEHDIALNYLEVGEITYSGINIDDGVKYIKAYITLIGSTVRDNVVYPVSIDLALTIPLSSRDLYILVERASWTRIYAYPGSSGNTLTLTILNNETSVSLVDAVVEIAFPGRIVYPDKLIVYDVSVNPGSLAEVSFPGIFIPPETQPGIYRALVNITGVLRAVDGSFRYITIHREINVFITTTRDLDYVLPVFEVIDVFWGEGTPQYIYPGNSRAPLTVIIQNKGIVPSSDVVISIDNISPGEGVGVLNRAYICPVQISPGDTCTAIFYLDVSNATSGLKTIGIVIKYTLEFIGVNKVFTQNITIDVYLPPFRAGSGVRVAYYNWLNDNPVFPNTKGAVLTITLVNLEPYTVYSVWVTIKLPRCMYIHNEAPNTIYISGPLVSLQVTTVNYRVDLEKCIPGYVTIEVEIDYFLQTANSGIRKKDNYVFRLPIHDDSSIVEYVQSGWIKAPIKPPVYGAQYYVLFRNRILPQISNPILKIKLPKGVVESRSNSSEPWITPTTRIPIQQVPLPLDLRSNIIQLVSQTTTLGGEEIGVVERGDIVVFVISLNIEENITSFTAPYEFVFIDHWGFEYSISSSITVNLVTTPPLIEVYPETPLIIFKNGTAMLDIVVENKYNSTIGNLYVALIPISGNAIPLNAIRYVDKLSAFDKITLKYTLVFNPVQAAIGTMPISHSSAIFTITLIYTDMSGVNHLLNTTLAAMISPFIDISILPGVLAKHTGNTLIASGILVNTGISPARSVLIRLRYGVNETIYIVGDLDPSTQIPFRVETTSPYIEDYCHVIVEYRDEYGSKYTYEQKLNIVKVIEEKTTPPTATETADYVFRIIVVAAVIAMSALFFYSLHRYITKRTRLS